MLLLDFTELLLEATLDDERTLLLDRSSTGVEDDERTLLLDFALTLEEDFVLDEEFDFPELLLASRSTRNLPRAERNCSRRHHRRQAQKPWQMLPQPQPIYSMVLF